MVMGSTLEPADGHLLAIDLVAATNRLARARAGAAEHAGHDVALPIEHVGFVEPALRNQADIVRHVGMRGAADLAGNVGLVPVRLGLLGKVARLLPDLPIEASNRVYPSP